MIPETKNSMTKAGYNQDRVVKGGIKSPFNVGTVASR